MDMLSPTLLLVSALALACLFAFTGAWLGVRVDFWVRLRRIEKSFALLADDVEDLIGRFERNQKRDGLREARAKKEENQTLAQEASEILKTPIDQETGLTAKESLRRQLFGKLK